MKNPEPQEDLASLKIIVDQGEAFIELKKLKGWQLVEEFLAMSVDSLTESLLTENDFDKIKKTQNLVLAFRSLPILIEKSLVDAEQAKKEINNFLQSP